jgi:hypothetical protein
MACNCPLPTALTAIDATACPEELGQIQRVWFVRAGNVVWDTVDPTSVKQIPASIQGIGNLPSTVAPWNILTPLADDSKVILAPLFGGDITVTPSDAITFGGNDNSTLNGQTYFVSFADSTFSARFDQLTAAQTSQLKDLVCEDLEVYFINEDGDIIGRRNPSDTDLWTGIPVTNVALQSRNVQGFATRDSNIITFQLDADWDTTFEKQTPTDFNALTLTA